MLLPYARQASRNSSLQLPAKLVVLLLLALLDGGACFLVPLFPLKRSRPPLQRFWLWWQAGTPRRLLPPKVTEAGAAPAPPDWPEL